MPSKETSFTVNMYVCRYSWEGHKVSFFSGSGTESKVLLETKGGKPEQFNCEPRSLVVCLSENNTMPRLKKILNYQCSEALLCTMLDGKSRSMNEWMSEKKKNTVLLYDPDAPVRLDFHTPWCPNKIVFRSPGTLVYENFSEMWFNIKY